MLTSAARHVLIADEPRRERPRALRELLIAGAILALAVGARLAFVTVFPAQPVSDFRSLVAFGEVMRERSWAASSASWDLFNPGLPMVLSVLSRLVPAPPSVVARLATALMSGCLCLLPLLVWRGVVPDLARRTAALLIAVWPGQVVFSGVVAQDNWVLAPVVALATLAVRVLRTGRAHPLAAACLYVAGVAIRQEMLVVLLPAALAAGGALSPRRRRDLAVLAAAAALLLSLLASQRWLATGRFALTSRHGGHAALGAFVPGASVNGWSDPRPHVAAVAPRLLDDAEALRRGSFGLVAEEVRARPGFHLARIAAQAADLLVEGEMANTAWSLYQPDVLDAAARRRAEAIGPALRRLLVGSSIVLLALVTASVLLLRRSTAAWLLVLTAALKVGVHALTVAQGRYYLTVTVLGMLLVALGVEAALAASRATLVRCLAAGVIVALVVGLAAPRAIAQVRAVDVEPVRSYRFPLGGTRRVPARFDCAVEQGRLVALIPGVEASIVPVHPDPAPGERARLVCRPAGTVEGAVRLRVRDPYEPGGFPARMVQRIEVAGREVVRHDLAAEPGAPWLEVDLPRPLPFAVEVLAVQPDAGPQWGSAALTTVTLAPGKGPS